jgi:hypothetical protein
MGMNPKPKNKKILLKLKILEKKSKNRRKKVFVKEVKYIIIILISKIIKLFD